MRAKRVKKVNRKRLCVCVFWEEVLHYLLHVNIQDCKTLKIIVNRLMKWGKAGEKKGTNDAERRLWLHLNKGMIKSIESKSFKQMCSFDFTS